MKWYLILFILLFSQVTIAQDNVVVPSAKRDSIVKYAKKWVGTPYLWGGSSSNGFDCSGFVHYVFKHFNISVPRTSRSYKEKKNEVVLEQSSPGDVILFTGTNSSIREIGHVGIIISNVDGVIDFIHSSSSKKHYGVTITRYNASGYVKRFMKVVNILK